MSRFPRKVSRLVAVSALTAGIAGGIAAAIPASASASGSSVTPNASWLAGRYFGYSACNAAGAAGVRSNKWDYYICYPDIKNNEYYWLDVTDD